MRWIPIKKETLPPIDDGEDYPKKYLVRGKGDDPRSGWVDACFRTAEQMEYYSQGFDRAEYLDESPDSKGNTSAEEQVSMYQYELMVSDIYLILTDEKISPPQKIEEVHSKYIITKK
jgi:hypothetical protein